MKEEIKIDLSEDQKEKYFEVAAKDLFKDLLKADHDIRNLGGYVREHLRECSCDVDLPEPSKGLRMRYNIQSSYYNTQVVFGILEDWFKGKIENGQ